jgi:hypothetical protein
VEIARKRHCDNENGLVLLQESIDMHFPANELFKSLLMRLLRPGECAIVDTIAKSMNVSGGESAGDFDGFAVTDVTKARCFLS